MKIDRPRADGAAAGQADLCLAETREQRPERKHARTHRFDQLIRRLEPFDVSGRDLVRAKLGRQHGRAEVLEQTPLRDQVLYVRNIVQRDGLGRQQCRRETRQSRILRPADLDLSFQRIAALDQKFIHNAMKCLRSSILIESDGKVSIIGWKHDGPAAKADGF